MEENEKKVPLTKKQLTQLQSWSDALNQKSNVPPWLEAYFRFRNGRKKGGFVVEIDGIQAIAPNSTNGTIGATVRGRIVSVDMVTHEVIVEETPNGPPNGVKGTAATISKSESASASKLENM